MESLATRPEDGRLPQLFIVTQTMCYQINVEPRSPLRVPQFRSSPFLPDPVLRTSSKAKDCYRTWCTSNLTEVSLHLSFIRDARATYLGVRDVPLPSPKEQVRPSICPRKNCGQTRICCVMIQRSPQYIATANGNRMQIPTKENPTTTPSGHCVRFSNRPKPKSSTKIIVRHTVVEYPNSRFLCVSGIFPACTQVDYNQLPCSIHEWRNAAVCAKRNNNDR